MPWYSSPEKATRKAVKWFGMDVHPQTVMFLSSNKILIWKCDHNVTEKWTVAEGWGKYCYMIAIAKRTFTWIHKCLFTSIEREVNTLSNNLVGNGLSHPLENLRTYLRTQDMSFLCHRTFLQKSLQPQSHLRTYVLSFYS